MSESMAGVTTGVQAIARERIRQIEQEGWHPEHDAEHKDNELAKAALSYLMYYTGTEGEDPPLFWPWYPSWWKLSDDPIRNLEKAGALIAAEIDRLVKEGHADK